MSARTSQLAFASALTLLVLAATIVFYWPFLSGQESFYLGDIGLFFEPFCRYLGAALSTMHLPLWNPFPGLGTSQVALSSPGIFYPPNWLFACLPFSQALAVIMIMHHCLAACGGYLLASRFGFHPLAAACTGLSLAFSGYMFGLATNYTLVAAAAWLPLAAAAVLDISRQGGHKRALDVTAAACCTALFIATGRPEIVAPGMALLVFAALGQIGSGIAGGTFPGAVVKRCAWQFAAIALGIMLSAPAWAPALELLRASSRASAVNAHDMLAWSASYYDILCLILAQPFFDPYGSGQSLAWLSQPAARGYLPFLSSAYLGPVAFTLAFLGFTDKRWHWRHIALAGFLLSLCLSALGLAPGAAALLAKLPVLSFGRYPIKLIYFVVAAAAIAAGRGVHSLTTGSLSNAAITPLFFIWGSFACAGAGLLSASTGHVSVILPALGIDPQKATLQSSVVDAYMGSSLLAAGFAGLVSALLITRVARAQMSRSTGAIVLTAAAAAMMLACAGTFMRHGTEAKFFDHPCYIADIAYHVGAKDSGIPRFAQLYTVPFVLPPKYRSDPSQPLAAIDQYSRQILEGNTCIDYGVGTLFPYGGLSPAYLEKLTDAVSGCCTQFGAGAQGSDLPVGRLCQVTGTEFAVTQIFIGEPVEKLDPKVFTVLNEQPVLNVRIYRTKDCLPRAYLYAQWQVVPTHEAVIARYLSTDENAFVPASSGLLERHSVFDIIPADPESYRPAPDAPFGFTTPESYKWQPERIELVTNCLWPALAVVAEPVFPGWRAAIDGQPAAIMRTNGVCRSVYVPAGKHTVVFAYEPLSLNFGIGLACLSLFLMAALCLSGRVRA